MVMQIRHGADLEAPARRETRPRSGLISPCGRRIGLVELAPNILDVWPLTPVNRIGSAKLLHHVDHRVTSIDPAGSSSWDDRASARASRARARCKRTETVAGEHPRTLAA